MGTKNFLSIITEGIGRTAERPQSLQGDSLARYNYAKQYCKDMKVLDVGTGFGFGAEFIAKNGAKKVLGIDHDSRLMRQVSKSNKTKNLSFSYLDALALSMIDEKFDVILAFEVIEHLPVRRVNEFIALLYDHIVPGGVLLLSTPNGLKSQFFGKSLYNPYHTKEYKKDEIKSLLSGYFSKVDIKGYKMVNKVYIKTSSEISNRLLQKPIYFLGHFKLIRELLAFIPTNIKYLITGEDKLPVLTEKDYVYVKDIKDAYGLFAIAKKGSSTVNYHPKFSVIIANYNGQSYLRRCLDSVLASSYKRFEIIVCDDGSDDSSWDILNEYKARYGFVTLFRNRKNIGASISRNRAVMKARGEIVVFLDNDTVVDKHWLSGFAEVFADDLRVGAAQAVLLDLKEKDLVQHAGGMLAPQAGLLIPYFQWKKYKNVKKYIGRRNIIGVSAALAVKKDVFAKVRGFDIKESVHSEDIDFCWRIWIAGNKVVLAEKSFVFHLSKSVESRAHMGSNYFKVYFHLVKNSLRSFIKNYESANILRFLPEDIAVNFARGLLVFFRRADLSAFSATISALFWNIINLPDTLRERKLIQGSREVTDEYIIGKVFDKRNIIEIYNQEFKQTKLLW